MFGVNSDIGYKSSFCLVDFPSERWLADFLISVEPLHVKHAFSFCKGLGTSWNHCKNPGFIFLQGAGTEIFRIY